MAGITAGPNQSTNVNGQRNMPPLSGEMKTEYWTKAGTVEGPLTRLDTDALAERAQATIADPLPLGLAGFASATFTVSSIFAGWFHPGPQTLGETIPVLLIFGGIAQFLAGMWAFRRGNVLAATAFSAFGSFNTAFAILLWLQAVHLIPNSAAGGDPAYVVGIFVLTFGLIALYLGIAALGENLWVALILFTLALTYAFDGVGVMVGGDSWVTYVGGYCGLVSSCLAFLLSAALVINSAMRRKLIPTMARS